MILSPQIPIPLSLMHSQPQDVMKILKHGNADARCAIGSASEMNRDFGIEDLVPNNDNDMLMKKVKL